MLLVEVAGARNLPINIFIYPLHVHNKPAKSLAERET